VDRRVGQVLLELRMLSGKVGKPLEHLLTSYTGNGLMPRATADRQEMSPPLIHPTAARAWATHA
jgi:hypothetical protein